MSIPHLALWYRQPAEEWDEALPLGNGSLGAMVHGGVPFEQIDLNLDTFWMGVPHDYDAPEATASLGEIRRLLFAGEESAAGELASRTFMGVPSCQTAYQPPGSLWIEETGACPGTGYRRELDLSDGVATTSFAGGCGAAERELFCSFPDQVLAFRQSSEGKISLTLGLRSSFEKSVSSGGGADLLLCGQWTNDGTERPWTADVREPGMHFAIGLRVLEGSAEFFNGRLVVSGDRAVSFVLAGATSFRNYRDIGADPVRLVQSRLETAAGLGHSGLHRRHVEDFSSKMSRVHLELGGSSDETAPTDERLERVKKGGEDPGLEILHFQYGRYLLLSSSREGSQPANLQGIWNPDIAPAWGSKWTTNINLQMNYWHAETGHLADCHGPLFDLLDDLRVTGAKTAQNYYGARGWVLHHNTDLWRGTAPVDGVWGIWAMGAAWLVRHAWEHYQFSQNEGFLRGRAWPLMKEAAEFLLDFLVEAPPGVPGAGHLVTCPSHSPENHFIKSDGAGGLFTHAATMDLMIARDLFVNSLEAARALGIEESDAQFCDTLRDALSRLAPLQISPRDGRLQEWIEDYEDGEPGHRHISHAYGLYPGDQITPEDAPELARALRKTLDERLRNGGGGTGWSRAWLISLFARLGDGDGARSHLIALLARCTLQNLFDTHPPFQIDGNFGASAGVIEMLVQSRMDRPDHYKIHLLPALPMAWPSGRVAGIRARGGFTVSFSWSDHRVTSCRIDSGAGRPFVLRAGDSARDFHPAAGQSVQLAASDLL